jgi:hypothetical protein
MNTTRRLTILRTSSRPWFRLSLVRESAAGRRRLRRGDRRALRAERRQHPHEYGADRAWGDAWKGGGTR